jgi:hypothetical protein
MKADEKMNLPAANGGVSNPTANEAFLFVRFVVKFVVG